MSSKPSLAQIIEEDLRSRILQGRRLPSRWTLAGLAGEFEVSFTPVKTALEGLVRDGLLLKGENNRLEINPRRRGRVTGRRRSGGLRPRSSGDLDERVTREIIRHSLAGEPVYLREASTAAQLKVGRTVIRQVFSRLAGAGLIEHVPRRGWRVPAFREADMLEYLEVRETLESRALELAWDRLDPARIARLLEGNQPAPGGEPRLDNTLHAYWIEQSGNRYLQAFFAQHGVYYAHLFDFATFEVAVIADMAKEHCAILKAILHGDRKKAARALGRHIRSQRPNVARLFARL